MCNFYILIFSIIAPLLFLNFLLSKAVLMFPAPVKIVICLDKVLSILLTYLGSNTSVVLSSLSLHGLIKRYLKALQNVVVRGFLLVIHVKDPPQTLMQFDWAHLEKLLDVLSLGPQ